MPIVTNAERYEAIRKHANTKGVTILLDSDPASYNAKIESLYSYHKKDKILTINIYNLSAPDKKFLISLIRSIHNEDGLLWKENRNESLRRYRDFSKAGTDDETIEFFSSILPPNDLICLKLSFFMRSELKAGRSVQRYKEDIRSRFGERGNVIANLCTANYFENEFMPLYMQMLRADFLDYYEKVVEEKIRALFIHSGMSQDDIASEVEKMVSKAIKYHMDDFKIHAIGKSNIDVLQKYISSIEVEEESRFKIKRTYFNNKVPAIEYTVEIIN